MARAARRTARRRGARERTRQPYAYARGDVLVALRNERALTREDAAHEIGTTTKSLYEWEVRSAPIKRENAERLARYYSVDLDTVISRVPDDLGATLLRMERKLDALMHHHGLELDEDS